MRWLVVCLVMVGLGLGPLPAWAQSLAFFGTVGGARVFVSLERDGDKLSGWYLYVRQGKSIRLEGTGDAVHAVARCDGVRRYAELFDRA